MLLLTLGYHHLEVALRPNETILQICIDQRWVLFGINLTNDLLLRDFIIKLV